jgi:hypothetical protein
MEFNGTPRPGGFCLPRLSAGCPARIYRVPNVGVSLSGAPSETYCGISQEDVTCEAVRDLGDNIAECPSGADAECGCERNDDGDCVSTPIGGRCEMVGVSENRCTYTCGLPEHCPNGTTCNTDEPWCK